MNSVVLIGRLVRDIEVRFTANGNAVSNFTMAVQRQFKNENGDYDTDFINCVIFNKSAEFMKDYAKKGDVVAIKGSIQTSSFTDKDGNKKSTTQVVVDQINLVAGKKKEDTMPF